MKLNITKILILILMTSACVNQKRELKEYGYGKKENDSLKVSLRLDGFKTYGEFIDRIIEVSCNDSIPRIVIESKNIVRNIYPTQDCEPFIFDPAGKHYVTFNRGKVYHEQSLPEINLDSLSMMLHSEFSYYHSSNSTDKPDNYFVIIESMRDEKTVGIESFINTLAIKYDSLKTDVVLNLAFWEQVPYHPPTPMGFDTLRME
ncbi:hypothetical protein [Cellulophaga sp. Hel_I_12]|uniref:hypothetical protein n=1 Tax=Cellulophaga sp. Hel_I_12 TaxID=1249972 RepID=UPI0006482002|nr:hypothetical protein [Cellulophaga sp. Hel_I_12]